ncbi:hypothetical protein Sru01_12080 [Sphaerisporangium rufum]|uniref:Condensation domain-containing protein n=1 Tax=Sphaerisporangium rufum TaxID=1381558 RepID=A0A919UWP5_9ACTN|nr:condensation domain-containing protein [Sphaerisporangium rufum]GII76226.1 hypothetical protein Sru01_12080 [Sphaerisporangium rufum]
MTGSAGQDTAETAETAQAAGLADPARLGELGADQARLLEREVEAALRQQGGVADCAVVFQGATVAAGPRDCVRCNITERYPGITFDDAGVCNLCQMYEANRERIHAFFGEPAEMVRRIRARAAARGSAYDCLLLFSGGKDSTYVLHQLVDLGLRVMTFTFDNGFISKTALNNVKEITESLGIEHVTATRADQNKIFLLSLQQHKSVCNGCFRSLLDLSTELAHQRGIPTIVTGLSRGQIIDERLSWFYQQGVFDPAEIEPKLAIGRKIYHQSGSAIEAAAVDSVEVVDYFRYSDVTKTGIREFLQRTSSFWSQPQDTGFCSSNCMINDVGVYVHNQERGYHNYEAPTRWEVRVGHLTVPEADEELRTPVNIPRVKRMLAKIGYADPADRARLGSRLVAYYVPDGVTDPDELRAAVARVVPDILVPERWVPVESIPRAGGQVLREELAPPRPTRFGTELADAADEPADAVPADPVPPLTPAQFAVLSRPGRPERHARALLLEPPGRADPARAKKAMLQLLMQHEALRARFERHGSEWRRRDGGVGALPVIGLDLSRMEPDVEPGLLRAAADRMRSRIDLAAGPLVQLAVIDRGARPSWLLLVVHELAADGHTWRLLLDDLSTAWRQLAAGEPVVLAPVDPAPDPAGPALDTAGPAPVAGTAGVVPVAGSAVPAGEACVLPAGDGEDQARLRVRSGDEPVAGGPAAGAVLAALAAELTARFGGDHLAVEVTDHSGPGDRAGAVRLAGAHTAPRTLLVTADGTARPAPAGTVAQVRYDHFGDLARLLPAGAPLALAGRDEVDLTAPPAPAGYPLTVTGAVRDGRAYLDWWCGGTLRAELAAAGVPDRVAATLSGAGTGVG